MTYHDHLIIVTVMVYCYSKPFHNNTHTNADSDECYIVPHMVYHDKLSGHHTDIKAWLVVRLGRTFNPPVGLFILGHHVDLLKLLASLTVEGCKGLLSIGRYKVLKNDTNHPEDISSSC